MYLKTTGEKVSSWLFENAVHAGMCVCACVRGDRERGGKRERERISSLLLHRALSESVWVKEADTQPWLWGLPSCPASTRLCSSMLAVIFCDFTDVLRVIS